jgi:hypothetical protein
MSAPSPEQWQRIESLLHAVLEQPAASRAAFLTKACGGDEVLLQGGAA